MSFVAPAPGPVRRSHRLAVGMTRLGDVDDPRDVDGEEGSATTKTEDEYSPGEFFFLVGVVKGLLPSNLVRFLQGFCSYV